MTKKKKNKNETINVKVPIQEYDAEELGKALGVSKFKVYSLLDILGLPRDTKLTINRAKEEFAKIQGVL